MEHESGSPICKGRGSHPVAIFGPTTCVSIYCSKSKRAKGEEGLGMVEEGQTIVKKHLVMAIRAFSGKKSSGKNNSSGKESHESMRTYHEDTLARAEAVLGSS